MIVFGALLVVLAIILLALGASEYSTTTSKQIQASEFWTIDEGAVTAESAQVSWHGSPSTMHVYLVKGVAKCPPTSGILVNRTGSKGGFSVTLQAGGTYEMFACSNGALIELNVTLAVTGGVSWAVVFGGAFGLIGLPLLLIGLRGHAPSNLD